MENAVPPPQHHVLARRLTFRSGTGLYSEEGWRVRVILQWQRLVRAAKVRRARASGPMWRAAEQHRQRRIATQQAAANADADWYSDPSRERGQRYEWRAEEHIRSTTGATSGAAAVIARRSGKRPAPDYCETGAARRRQRRDDGEAHDASSPAASSCAGKRALEDGSGDPARQRARVEDVSEELAADAPARTPRRQTDRALIYTPSMRTLFASNARKRRREPFGDG